MTTDIEKSRYELGRKAREKGESLHGDASDEFKRGYSRIPGFGSNVMPKKFGRHSTEIGTWDCVCGEVNRDNRVAKRAGIIVCWKCGVEKDYSEDKDGQNES